MYEYRTVPFLASVGGRDQKSAQHAADQLTSAINANALDGWELYQVANVSVEVKPGCLAALAGGRPGTLLLDQLIFRRERKNSV